MYDEMTTADLIVTAHNEAHPENGPSAEHAYIIDELAQRLKRLDVWRSQMVDLVDAYLAEEDGSDLIPDHARVSNMLNRISDGRNTADALLRKIQKVVSEPRDVGDTVHIWCREYFSPNAGAQLPPEREARRERKPRQRVGRSTAAIC